MWCGGTWLAAAYHDMSRRDLASCGVHSANQLTIPQLERFWNLFCGLCWKLCQTKGCNHVGTHGSFNHGRFRQFFLHTGALKNQKYLMEVTRWQILMSVFLNGYYGFARCHGAQDQRALFLFRTTNTVQRQAMSHATWRPSC